MKSFFFILATIVFAFALFKWILHPLEIADEEVIFSKEAYIVYQSAVGEYGDFDVYSPLFVVCTLFQ